MAKKTGEAKLPEFGSAGVTDMSMDPVEWAKAAYVATGFVYQGLGGQGDWLLGVEDRAAAADELTDFQGMADFCRHTYVTGEVLYLHLRMSGKLLPDAPDLFADLPMAQRRAYGVFCDTFRLLQKEAAWIADQEKIAGLANVKPGKGKGKLGNKKGDKTRASARKAFDKPTRSGFGGSPADRAKATDARKPANKPKGK